MAISSLNALSGYGALDKLKPSDGGPVMQSAENFAKLFDDADKSVAGFASGAVDAQRVVEAISQAEMALQTAVTVRDRVVGAYQELLRMPL